MYARVCLFIYSCAHLVYINCCILMYITIVCISLYICSYTWSERERERKREKERERERERERGRERRRERGRGVNEYQCHVEGYLTLRSTRAMLGIWDENIGNDSVRPLQCFVWVGTPPLARLRLCGLPCGALRSL